MSMDFPVMAISESVKQNFMSIFSTQFSLELVKEKQLLDKEIQEIVCRLSKNKELKELYEIKDDILYRKIYFDVKDIENDLLQSQDIIGNDKRMLKPVYKKRYINERNEMNIENVKNDINEMKNSKNEMNRKNEKCNEIVLKKNIEHLDANESVQSVQSLNAEKSVQNCSTQTDRIDLSLRRLSFSVPVIPHCLRVKVLEEFHDSPISGHLGVKRTKLRIKSRAFWSGMSKDIHEYVKTCKICQTCKIEALKPRGFLELTEPAKRVFEVIFVDLIGPLPVSSGGRRNEFVLVVVDQLSKWVEIFPLREAKSSKICTLLEDEVFCRYGSPSILVSDNGSQFTSKMLIDLCKSWKIKHKFISLYHPQANLAERINRNLKTLIICYITKNQSDWDIHLQKFALALRSYCHEGIQVAPSMLNLGRNIQLPFDRAMNPVNPLEELDLTKYSGDLEAYLNDLIIWVRENMKKAQISYKKYYDKDRSESNFKVGELVLRRNKVLSSKDDNFSAKLAHKWIGPVKIVEQITPVSYKVLDLSENGTVSSWHVADLKPYYERNGVNLKPKLSEQEIQRKIELRPRKRINYKY